MDLQNTFTDAELEKIINEAMLYMCACPAQVAAQISDLRGVLRYQRNCLQTASGAAIQVHQTIAEATLQAHRQLEQCLDQVLQLEGWDRQTLTMPAGLRQLRDDDLAQSSSAGS